MSTAPSVAVATIHPELQKAVDEGRLTAAGARALNLLEPGAYCQHKSWGFGRVSSWDLSGNRILIDFGPKKEHPMQIQYAGDNLKPVPPEHLLARKAADLPAVKKMMVDDPAGIVRLILEHSDHHRATPTQIAALLAPDVVSGEAEFKRWWEGAKKHLKKDGRFVVPAKKTEFAELRELAQGQNQALLAQFERARQLKAQLAALDQIYKNIEDFKADPAELSGVLATAGASAVRNQRLDVNAAFELLVTRDEIASAVGGDLSATITTPSLAEMMREEEGRLGEVIGHLPAAKQRFALHQMPIALGDDKWAGRALTLLPQTHKRARRRRGRPALRRAGPPRGVPHPSRPRDPRLLVTCEMLLWLSKERHDPKYADFANPRLFKAILSALERDAFSDIKRSTRLHDTLSSDRELITELLKDADAGELRSAARALLATPALEELDKRSLMARLIKLHPELHTLLTGGGEEKPVNLTVSWASLEKRKLELDDLVNKQIPKNIEEISIAREYGDLRENFEFKAAKEMQAVLARRRAELERDLGRARGTNFENPDTNIVSIGTVVTLKDTESGASETYTILGAWDGNPEQHILSYLTTIGQALLGHKVGETINLPDDKGGSSRTAKIETITAYQIRMRPLTGGHGGNRSPTRRVWLLLRRNLAERTFGRMSRAAT